VELHDVSQQPSGMVDTLRGVRAADCAWGPGADNRGQDQIDSTSSSSGRTGTARRKRGGTRANGGGKLPGGDAREWGGRLSLWVRVRCHRVSIKMKAITPSIKPRIRLDHLVDAAIAG